MFCMVSCRSMVAIASRPELLDESPGAHPRSVTSRGLFRSKVIRLRSRPSGVV